MKKFFVLIFIILMLSISFFIDFGNKVFLVKSPCEVFIDLNKNFVFDEKIPVAVTSFKFINNNIDFEKYPDLKSLTDDEIFFLEYMANETSQNILLNRFVKVVKNDIIIDNQKYSELMLKSKFVFDDTKTSQQELIKNIKSINLNDYVILNLKNKKYHKLNCQLGRKSSKFKIVKLSEIKNTAEYCKNCHLPDLNLQETKKEAYGSEVFSTENIKVFFIDLNKIFKPNNECKEPACKTLKQEIDNAQNSIDFAVYGINNQPQILNSLINAQKRGVKIRRVYDYSDKKYYEDNDKLDKIIKTFKTDELYDKTNEAALMHNKYFIFDNTKVFTGSSNISSTDLSGFNSNYTVLINSKAVANAYKQDFEQMYNGIFHKSKKSSKCGFIQINPNIRIKPLFSPQDNIINSEIIPLINNARKYIYMPVFFITNKKIEEALILAHSRNVEIKVINDATNSHTKYTVHKNLRKAGIKVKTENYAGKMHSKVMIIDNKYSVIGSMNFTKSGNSKNDENVLIIESEDTAKFMRSTFMYLWNKIPQKYEFFDPQAESQESIGSCFDGIDNDFDEKTDFSDEGCFVKH